MSAPLSLLRAFAAMTPVLALVSAALLSRAGSAAPIQESGRTPIAEDSVGAQERGTAPAVESAAGESSARRAPLRYVRARTGGVTVRNLADVHGLPLVDVPSNALLAVYSESAGWLEVDVPGGVPVWVFGRYLSAVEGSPGVLEVTRNHVLMRPRAGSDVNNFPLSARLVAGDQVAEIAREDATLPLAETWVRIWAPPAACGWVQVERTSPLAAGENGAKLFAEAEAASAGTAAAGSAAGRAAVPSSDRAGAREAAAPVSERLAAIRAAIETADEFFASERDRGAPDFLALRDAYRGVLALPGGDEFTATVAEKIAMVDALAEIHRTRALLEEERVERQRERERRQAEQWDRLRERDPFYGRFAVRGVLERFQDKNGVRTYRVSRGGEAQAVIRCSSGRYDLELFVGREIGFDGAFVVVEESTILASGETSAFAVDLPALDAATLEVLR